LLFLKNYFLPLWHTEKSYPKPVVWDEDITEYPVAAEVIGIVDINEDDGSYRNFSHVYHFFDFETRIVDKLETFSVSDVF
jgi:hypothetical protein